MKILPEKEFRALVIEQEFAAPEGTTGFIDRSTQEAVVPSRART